MQHSQFFRLALLSACTAGLIVTTPVHAEEETKTSIPQEVHTSLQPAEKPVTPTVVTPKENNSGMPAQKTPEQALKRMTENLGICAREKDRMLRTRCYDDMSVELGLMDDQMRNLEKEKLGTFGYWQVTSEKDMLGVETIYVTISPINKLMATTLQSKNPTFNIRCRQGQTDAYLDWKSALNAQRVILRDIFVYNKIDSMPEYRETWSLSLDGYAAFSPRAVDFAKSLKDHDKLLLRITPYGGTMETLAFELAHFDRALDVLIKRCYPS